MRKIGLIGGMSWTSTVRYYQIINGAIATRLGGLHSAPMLIESLDFSEVARTQTDEEWERTAAILIDAARRLEQAGATALVICANSMHKVYDQVAAAVSVPILHIADAVGEKMKADGVKSAALIGTRNVMTERFYRQRLVSHGISLTPPDLDRANEIDRIIYEELAHGKATRNSERTLKTILTNIYQAHVPAVVLACTELEMIVDVRANVLPIYDGTTLHAMAAVRHILGE
ncbi:MAG: amino acid racemase [Alphaproteobacteria bacterium]|nr:amino acid racemase [Alphaproteobacteria bacterium]